MKQRKTWQEKLFDSKDLPKTIVIPAPLEVDALMKRVPHGRLTTINQLRQELARRHGTQTACPMTTGIFAWIAANASAEAAAAGRADPTPFWRTLKSDGELNPRYPGGLAAQKKKLLAEGHKVVRKGKALVVADLEESLFSFGETP